MQSFPSLLQIHTYTHSHIHTYPHTHIHIFILTCGLLAGDPLPTFQLSRGREHWTRSQMWVPILTLQLAELMVINLPRRHNFICKISSYSHQVREHVQEWLVWSECLPGASTLPALSSLVFIMTQRSWGTSPRSQLVTNRCQTGTKQSESAALWPLMSAEHTTVAVRRWKEV